MDANKKCQCHPSTVNQLKERRRSDKPRIKDWVSSAFDSFPKQDRAGSGRVWGYIEKSRAREKWTEENGKLGIMEKKKKRKKKRDSRRLTGHMNCDLAFSFFYNPRGHARLANHLSSLCVLQHIRMFATVSIVHLDAQHGAITLAVRGHWNGREQEPVSRNAQAQSCNARNHRA
jgi:hypothetical protein